MNLKKIKLPNFAGKASGLVLGFILGSWTGAALGIILGHSFDFHRQSVFSLLAGLKNKFGGLALPKPKERVYRDTLFVCLGYVAKQEGRVSPQSIAAAEALFKRLRLNSRQREAAINLFNEGKLTTSVEAKLELLAKRYASKKAQRLSFIEQLLNVAYAGKAASAEQLATLQSFLPVLNLSRQDFEQLHQKVRTAKGYKNEHNQNQVQMPSTTAILSAYRTLGLRSGASPEEIKLSYRKLMSQHHPDKLMAQGVTEQALERGKHKAQEIQQAYAVIKKSLP